PSRGVAGPIGNSRRSSRPDRLQSDAMPCKAPRLIPRRLFICVDLSVIYSALRERNNIRRDGLMSDQPTSEQAGATSRRIKKIGGNDAYSPQNYRTRVFWSRGGLARGSRGSTGASAGGRYQFLRHQRR